MLSFIDVTWGLATSNRTRATVHHVTVGSWLTCHPISFHDTLKPFTFGDANHINHLTFGETIHVKNITYFLGWFLVTTDLFERSVRSNSSFFIMSAQLLSDVCDLGFTKTNLNCVIAISCSCFYLHNRTWTYFDNGDRNKATFFIVDLGHPNFFT